MKGHTNNPNGRPSGATNRITREVRKIVAEALEQQTPHLQSTLDQIREESPVKYIELITRLLPYVAPKLSNITFTEDTTSVKGFLPIWMNENKHDTTTLFRANNKTPEQEQELLKTMEKVYDESTGEPLWRNKRIS